MAEIDYQKVGAEWLAALRGRLARERVARWLECGATTVYAWETGRRDPPATVLLRLAARRGHQLASIIASMAPAGKGTDEPTISELVAVLAASHNQRVLARTAGVSPYALSRWIHGHTEPRLSEFLSLVQAVTFLLPDLVARTVDPEKMASIRPAWKRLQAERKMSEEPWVWGYRAALGLQEYADLPEHVEGWLAERLGRNREEERTLLRFLAEAGQIRWTGRKWVETGDDGPPVVLTEALARRMHAWGLAVASERALANEGSTQRSMFLLATRAEVEQIVTLQQELRSRITALVPVRSVGDAVVVVSNGVVVLNDRGPARVSGRSG